MPIYEYKCPKCNVVTSCMFRMSEDKPVQKCPECKSSMDRIFSVPHIQFVGADFETNRSRAEKHRNLINECADEVEAHGVSEMEIEHGTGLMEEKEKQMGMRPGLMTGNYESSDPGTLASKTALSKSLQE